MRRLMRLLLSGLGVNMSLPAAKPAPPPLLEVQVVALPAVQRRIDHFALDAAGQRLFVAALGNHTLEVVDLAAGKRIKSIPDLNEPQGVEYLPSVHRIVVATRAGGTVTAFDDRNYRPVATISNMPDADNLRFDAAAGELYLGHGDGALAVIDPASMKVVAQIPLPGHPESFRLEEGGPRIFVNMPPRARSSSSIEPSVRSSRVFPSGASRTTTRCRSTRKVIGCSSPYGTPHGSSSSTRGR